jgi:hypothetical protein
MAVMKPTYEFVITNGTLEPADGRMRSHAIRAGLQTRKGTLTGPVQPSWTSQSASSGFVVHSEKQLRGRFRITTRQKPNATTQEQELKDTSVDAAGIKSRTRTRLSGSAPAFERSTVNSTVLSIHKRDGATPVLLHKRVAPETIGQGWLDPFGSVPVQNNWRVDSLLKHCMDQPILWLGGR